MEHSDEIAPRCEATHDVSADPCVLPMGHDGEHETRLASEFDVEVEELPGHPGVLTCLALFDVIRKAVTPHLSELKLGLLVDMNICDDILDSAPMQEIMRRAVK